MESVKRDCWITFRVTKSEYDAIHFLAKRDRRTPSDYIRLTVLDFARNDGNGWREWLDEKASRDE